MRRASSLTAIIARIRRIADFLISTENVGRPRNVVNCCNHHYTCAVERRWTTAGESPARELGSLHPEAIRAAAEETKPPEPLV